jgi:ArsR family transcriptional regulator
MNKTNFAENLEARAQLFKALGHPVRLLILNLVRDKPRHGEELAAILKLKPATISHHLSKLTEAGLLSAHKDQYYQIYSLVEDKLDLMIGEVVGLPQPGMQAEVAEDAFQQKVLRTFFVHGRLKQWPAQRKKQQIVLEKIAEEFEPERRYSEREVNQVLIEINEDVATLRRALIDHKYMRREQGIYWRMVEDARK